ncbi:MAG TPA: hypothetical protein VM432_02460, partial [Bdellovibrionales bacterium]|nr:hypothetical protein [Bdellovibrionales bacterium]
VIGFSGFSESCQEIKITGTQLKESSFECGGQKGYTDSPTGFGGIGLAVGFGSLRFNVFSYMPARDIEPFEITSYSLSLGIPL